MAESITEGPLSTLSGGSAAVSLGRITQRTTPGSVAHVLRNAILEGRLKPGSQLRETHLAADLGVSRAPRRWAYSRKRASSRRSRTAGHSSLKSATSRSPRSQACGNAWNRTPSNWRCPD